MDLNLSYIDPISGYVIFSIGGWLLGLLSGLLGLIVIFFKKIVNFMRRHKFYFTFFCIIILVLFSAGFFFMKNSSQSGNFNRKIIILGMDGLSPKIMEPMMAQGKLPHFSMLKSHGSYKRLQTTNPPQSPVAWTAFSTGKNPAKTGIFDFILRDPKTYDLRLSLSNTTQGKVKSIIKDKRFWQYTSDKKIHTAIISHPLTFPPDAVFGTMLSGMGVPDILGTEGTFTFYTSEVLENKNTTGGKVFNIYNSRMMKLDFIGPKIKGFFKDAAHVKTPFRVVQKDKNTVYIIYENNKFELTVGEWSGWKEVAFKVGLFKKMRGVVRFYLASLEPEFNLYLSPINFDPKNPYFQISHPKKYSQELAEHIGCFHTQGMPADTWAVNEGRLGEDAALLQINTLLTEKKKILAYELNRFDRGLLFFYFGSSDVIQHMFWRYIDPKHPLYDDKAAQQYKTAIYDWYEKMDQILGEVMGHIGQEDTIIVLSDHGFGTFRRAVHLNSWLRDNGYLVLKNKSASSGQELLKDIDWTKTKAYALGFGGIYMNQKGREAEGIVESESEELKKEISEKLQTWVDQKHSEKIVSRVYLGQEIFWGDKANDAPDLYVGFHEGYRASWQTAMGAVPSELLEDNLKKWSGDHLFDPELVPGVLFMNKPLVQDTVSIYDMMPTILKMTGYDDQYIKALDLDGKSLF